MNQFEKLIESNTILSSLPSEIIKSHIQNRTFKVISLLKYSYNKNKNNERDR